MPIWLVALANGGLFFFVEKFWLTDSQNTITKSVTRGWYSDYYMAGAQFCIYQLQMYRG